MRKNKLTLINYFQLGGKSEVMYFSEILKKKVQIKATETDKENNPRFKLDAGDGEPSNFTINSGFFLSKFLRDNEIVSWQALQPTMFGSILLVVEYYPKNEEVVELDQNIDEYEEEYEKMKDENEKVYKYQREQKLI